MLGFSILYTGVLAVSFVIVKSKITICRDPKDNLFIDLALHSKASMLITGDQDLLVLADALSTHGLQVLPPAQALALLQAN